MSSRPQPVHTAALRDERSELRFCADLTDSEWCTASAAPGWQVKDVLAHIGAGCHSLFTPAALAMLGSKDIERTNDVMVDARRSRAPGDVLDEFTRWSARVVRLSGVVAATPFKALRLPQQYSPRLSSFPNGAPAELPGEIALSPSRAASTTARNSSTR